MRRTLVIVLMWAALMCMLTVWPNCAATANRQALAIDPPATTQPTTRPAVDVQQVAGQFAAALSASLDSRIDTAVKAEVTTEVAATGVGRDATWYRSDFGIGATLAVTLALVLSLTYSHRREVLRIQRDTAKCASTKS